MLKSHYLQKYKPLRKVLRHKMTEEEVILWSFLKNKQLGYKFRRQAGIGKYIVDFYCPGKGLIIELDGGQHNEDKNLNYDKERDEYLRTQELKIIRIWNNEIRKNLSGVLEEIKYQLKD
jgi:very-short-patch-repair endonuclease